MLNCTIESIILIFFTILKLPIFYQKEKKYIKFIFHRLRFLTPYLHIPIEKLFFPRHI